MAFVLDEFLETIGDVNVTFFGNIADVARAKPTVFSQTLFGRLLVVEIT